MIQDKSLQCITHTRIIYQKKTKRQIINGHTEVSSLMNGSSVCQNWGNCTEWQLVLLLFKAWSCKFCWFGKNNGLGKASEILLIAPMVRWWSISLTQLNFSLFPRRHCMPWMDVNTHASTSGIRSSLLGKISDRSTRVKDLPRDCSLDSRCYREKGKHLCLKPGSYFVNAPPSP